VAGSPVLLNLGAGNRHLKGFINVDMADNWCEKAPDIAADLSKPLPFPDEYADEVHAYHLLEHFQRYEVDKILNDWVRVLKPGGKLVLELPCLDQIIRLFNHYVEKGKAPDPRMTQWGLYGDPRYGNPDMMHKWCYCVAELRWMLETLGLTVTFSKPQTHQPLRDMRAEGIKHAWS
jgi:predicted SAM-dependent methyltransferase